MGANVGLLSLPFRAQCTIIHNLRAKDQESISSTRGKSTWWPITSLETNQT
jgi:hypothetical protein